MDLEKHRVAWRWNGFPIFADDGDEVIGYVNEPEASWGDLTSEQQAQVRQEAIRLQSGREISWEDAFSFMLGDFGIGCPHEWQDHDSVYRECRLCRAVEKLPGVRVRVGDQMMRVPDPPPRVLRVVVPQKARADYSASANPLGAALEVAEYHWTGRGYQIASR